MTFKKKILVIGMTSGIGKEVFLNLLNNKFGIIGTYKNKKKIEFTKKLRRRKFILLKCNVANEKSVKNLSIKLKKENLFAVINCAGIIGNAGLIEHINIRNTLKVIKTNVVGPMLLFKYLIPLLKKKSLVINFSGGGGTNPMPRFDSYAISKASITRLVENLSLSYQHSGICFMCISPGPINTPMFDKILSQGEKRIGTNLWIDFKKRQKSGGSSMIKVLEFINKILLIKDKSILNGRTLSAQHDNIDKIKKNKNIIIKKNLYKIRRLDNTNQKIKF